ncbi:MAG: hypothetical protein H6937_09020 [Burkholderiales bacterium]|nr:hypothetical protein [Burkholderiales bacterium]MDR4518965.1 hypothetical protein [Nitrosomonas sp.]
MAKTKPEQAQAGVTQQHEDQASAEKQVNTDFTKCPYFGMGGRWIVNPETGCREPADDATKEMVSKLEEEKRLEKQAAKRTNTEVTNAD